MLTSWFIRVVTLSQDAVTHRHTHTYLSAPAPTTPVSGQRNYLFLKPTTKKRGKTEKKQQLDYALGCMRRFRSALSLQPDEQLMALNLMIRKTTTTKKKGTN